MDEPQLTKQQFARVFDITPRQVDNWVADGIPRITVGKSRYRYGIESLRWANRKNREGENGPAKSPKYRLDELKVETQELELLERKRDIIPMDAHEERLAVIIERVYSALKSMPSRFARRLVGAKKIADARVVLETVREEIIHDIRSIVTDDRD